MRRLLRLLLPSAVLFPVLLCAAPTTGTPSAAPAGKTQQLAPGQTPEGLPKSDWQNIRAAHTAWLHGFMPIEGGWQARNPGQQWNTKFDARGFLTAPKDGAWSWGLELRSYGVGEAQTAIGGQAPAMKAEGQRLTYQWDATLQEWWVNDARGLEHGYTVTQRPASTGNPPSADHELIFVLATRGTLTPKVDEDRLGVRFADGAGATVLTYAGLKVWDAEGKVLASRFEAAGDKGVRLLVKDDGARYPLTIDPIAQQAYVKPSDVGYAGAGDQFGISVAVAGDTVVVGAPFEDSLSTGINGTPNEGASAAGAAYVFVRSGTTWSQQAYLKPAAVGTTQTGDRFGTSVAVAGDTVVVGANLEDSSTTGINGAPDETATDAGAAYVFVRSGTAWSQQAYLKPAAVGTTQAGDQFGISVAVAGDTVVVGAPFEDSLSTGINGTPNEGAGGAGAAYVFVRSGTTWSQQAYLKPAAVGTTQAGDQFGISVAVAGDTVVVGASAEDSGTTGINGTPNETAGNAGAIYIFDLDRQPDIAVAQSGALTDGAGSVDFGGVSAPRGSAQLDFTITDPGPAALASLAIGKDGADAGDFTVSALSATSLPVGTGTVTFTVTFSPSAVGVRTAAIHITNNVAGLKNPFDIVLTGTGFNVAPVIGTDSMVRTSTSRVAKIAKSVLLGNDTDADGDTLTVTAVSNAQPSGAVVGLLGGFVTYTSPTATSGNGSFDYAVSDGFGHTVTGTVTVTEVSPAPSSEPPNTSGVVLSGTDVVLSYVGVAGNRYRVQYTTSSTAPYTWNEFNPIAVYTAPASGVFTHTDVNPTGPLRLYRAIPHR